jgi:type I restriction enzyme S subunit
MEYACNKATIPHFTKDKLLMTPFQSIPIEEQQEIVAYLDEITAKIDVTIDNAEREIALFNEYRTRLISDVVTGKIDVRNINVPEFEPIEEMVDVEPDECEIEEEQKIENH